MASYKREEKAVLPGNLSSKDRENFPHLATHEISLPGTYDAKLGSMKYPEKMPYFPIVDNALPTLLLQNWLLNNFRTMPLMPQYPAFHGLPAMDKTNFFLQDFNERYKDILLRNLMVLQRPVGQASGILPELSSGFNSIFPAPQQVFPGFMKSFNLNPVNGLRHEDTKAEIPTKPNSKYHVLPVFHPHPASIDRETFQTLNKVGLPRGCIGRELRGDISSDSGNFSSIGKDKKSHKCVYCGKLYSRKYGLKIHIRTHTGYKPLKCKVCGRPFGDPSNLNKHVRLHAEGETPYRCDFCGKVLVRRRDLERHIKSRHPDSAKNIEVFSNSWKIPSRSVQT